MNILLTGGRAPATLDLARVFHRAGHTVFAAESLRGHLSQPSAAIKANFAVPAPRQEKDAFIGALKKIVAENQIDLLIPTCEEVFYVAMGRDEFPCKVFTEPIHKLDLVHNKWKFAANENMPETMLIRSQDELASAFERFDKLVIKPVYSRFAARTLILPSFQKASSTLTFDSCQQWVAQKYIEGQAYCTYSVCHHGHVTAHTTYPSHFTAGQGATIVFEHVEHPAIFNWVKCFVEKNHFTGQIAFDFIQTSEGRVYVLECNPRATSGVHLLASHPQFVDAFLNPAMDCITPLESRNYMLASAMLVYGLPMAIRKNKFLEWLKTFLNSKDVIFNFKDPLPFLLQLRSIFSYLNLAREKGISPLEASTFDIEWNGEM
ncbi:MAG: ATP-grasp domain-containing protein [Chloroflexi bacterium]|nr:ATP-grasp domain-containing protein [Chloroflexota bacterium]